MQPWLKNAIDEFDNAAFNDGDMLSHAWLEWALQLPIPKDLSEVQKCQFEVLSRVDAFRNYLLLDRQVALKSIRGSGYQIVPPNEQAEYAARHAVAQVVRGLRNGTRIMLNTRMQGLTAAERTQHIDAETRLAGMTHMVQSQRRNVFQVFNPKIMKP